MQPRHCAGCGAPLTDAVARDGLEATITCRFCGLVHDAPSGNRLHIRLGRTPASSSASRLIGAIGLALGVSAAIVGGLVAFTSGRLASRVAREVSRAAVPSVREPAAVSVRGLGSLAPGRHALQAAPPPGGYGALDAMAQVPWAITIAQGWAEDAQLERIDVTRVRPDGTVNVLDDDQASVRYRFFSPHASRVLLARRQTSTRATATTSFWVEVAQGTPVVMALGDDGEATMAERVASPPEGLPLTRLIPALRETPRYTAPFLKGYLIHLEEEGWVWYLSALTGESLPRVRASDGRAWPYARARPR